MTMLSNAPVFPPLTPWVWVRTLPLTPLRVVVGVGVGAPKKESEEIWNQNSGPEGQNFDSKFPAPHN